MYDFFSFNSFITQKVLVIFYYLGAIGFPLFMLLSRKTVIKKFAFLAKIESYIKTLFHSLQTKEKIKAAVALTLLFFFMELFWRMFFEMMIGYFDMHDYLQELSKKL